MKSVSCFRDLEQFGIRPLTGEADALGYRILCDLTEEGVRVFKQCFGIPYFSPECADPKVPAAVRHGLADNWNSGAVASVMLSEDSIKPLAVMGFYLQGHVVIVTDTCVHALEEDELVTIHESGGYYIYQRDENDDPMRWLQGAWGNIKRIIRPRVSDGKVVQGTRNVHQMTGRVL